MQDPCNKSIGLTVKKITSGDIREMPPSVTQGCKDLIQSLLDLDPKKRPLLEDVRSNKWVLKSTAAFLYRTQMSDSTSWKISSRTSSQASI